MYTWRGIDPAVAEAEMRGLTRRLAEVEDAIEHAQKLKASSPGSFSAQLGFNSLISMRSALENERVILLGHRHRENLTVALKGPKFADHSADLANLGVFLVRLQKLYTSIAQAVTVGPSLRGPVGKGIVGASTLRFADVFPSSFGMQLFIEQSFDMFGDSVASTSLQTLFNLLSSSTREFEISRLSAELGPRTVSHLRRVLDDLARADAGLSVEWIDPAGTSYSWQATGEDVKSFRQNTSRYRTENSEVVSIEGFLTGASLLKDRFEFVSTEGVVIEGKMTKFAKLHIREFFARGCVATFDRVIVLETVTGEHRVFYTMTGISSLPDNQHNILS